MAEQSQLHPTPSPSTSLDIVAAEPPWDGANHVKSRLSARPVIERIGYRDPRDPKFTIHEGLLRAAPCSRRAAHSTLRSSCVFTCRFKTAQRTQRVTVDRVRSAVRTAATDCQPGATLRKVEFSGWAILV